MKKTRLHFISAPEINATTEAAPAWIELAPFGEHRSRDGKRVQVLDEETAKELVAMFDYWPRRVARLFGMDVVPVWLGHPDFAPEEWPEKIQLGSIVELAVKDSALWGRVTWTDEGLRVLSERKHRFPSVAWDVEYGAPDAEGLRRGSPVLLWSVGVWHQPNIPDTSPIINAAMTADDENLLSGMPERSTKPTPENKDTNTMKDKLYALLAKLGILPETAPEGEAAETEVLAAVESQLGMMAALKDMVGKLAEALGLGADAQPADILAAAVDSITGHASKEANAVQEKAEMETELNAARTERARHALAPALASGAVSKAQLPAAIERLAKLKTTEFNAALAEINAARPVLKIGGGLRLPDNARERLANADSRRVQRAEINAKVNAIMVEKKLDRVEALKLVQAEHPQFFASAKTDV
jgi:hypothetical protein